MRNNGFSTETKRIKNKEVGFSRRVVQGGYSIYVPLDFYEDKNFVSNYTYLFSKDESPLSIAIRFTSVSSKSDRKKMIDHYFSQTINGQELPVDKLGENICLRESVTDGKYLSVYSLRFTIEVDDGVLFGCFNCSADSGGDWSGTVLEMLGSIKKSDGGGNADSALKR